jgi:peptide/nickel transport system permease protein
MRIKTRSESGWRVAAAAERAGTVLMVGYPKRYDPAFLAFQKEAAGLTGTRLLRVTTLESPFLPYVGHYPLLPPPAALPAGLAGRLRAEHDASVASALGADATEFERRIYQPVLLDTMVHEFNTVRGLLGEPDRLDYVDVRDDSVTAMCLAIVLVALLAPLIATYPEDAGSATHPLQTLEPPSAQHYFGTDQVGRDVFSRVVYGARISPVIAVLVLTISVLVGVPLGIAAGYFGGAVDEVISRVTDVFLAFPALLLALAFAAVMQPSITNTVIAISVTWWPWYTRIVRGQAASVTGRPFVESAKATGIPHRTILLRHVLPNSITPIIVQVSLDVGGVILTASALSFLGLGAQDPTPDWGLMVSQGQAFFTTQWWLVTFPGAAIFLTAVAFNLLGDGLRDVLDPRRVLTTR